VGDNVGTPEGASVGEVVGKGVGTPVSYVGEKVGNIEGAAVGEVVGDGVVVADVTYEDTVTEELGTLTIFAIVVAKIFDADVSDV